MVRDPIIRQISIFFQQIKNNFPNGIKTNQIIDRLQSTFAAFDESKDFVSHWFDREIKINFKIDVYDFAFDKDIGYSIIKEKDKSVLVIRLEDLNNCFNSAIEDFLQVKKNQLEICKYCC